MDRCNAAVPAEPDPVLLVGQDLKGHWLVQDTTGYLEGCFVSRATALGFARSECAMLHATMRMADAPLVPRIAF